jgi:hypothetical protein
MSHPQIHEARIAALEEATSALRRRVSALEEVEVGGDWRPARGTPAPQLVARMALDVGACAEGIPLGAGDLTTAHGTLYCPAVGCRDDYTHSERVEYTTHDDGGMLRGQATLFFWCEQGHRFVVQFLQSKGMELVSTRRLADQPQTPAP